MIKLNPNEIVIGMDEPVAKSTQKFIRSLFARWEFSNYKIIEVSQSNDWNFHAAHVVWECYRACRYDRILETNIDIVLRPAMLKGLSLVGRNGAATVSFRRRPLLASMRDRMRYYIHRLLDRNPKYAGLCWTWRPHYMDAIDLPRFQAIQNGWDTFMYISLEAKGYQRLSIDQTGGQCLDMENPDLPWRQFAYGIWFAAHPEHFGQNRRKTFRRIIQATNLRIPLSAHLRAFRHQWPYIVDGYKWAKEHQDHKAVRLAAKLSYPEWTLIGSELIADLVDWKKIGKTGTGFD